MKKLMSVAAVFAFSVVLFSTTVSFADSSITYDGPPKKIRFSVYYPAAYPVYEVGLSKWIPMVEKESNGKIIFDNYFGGVLHSAKDGFRAMVSDIADITTGYPAYQPGSFNLCLVADMPFTFTNSWTAGLIMEELYPKYFKKEYENNDVYLAFYTCTSNYNLISKKPVRKFEDLKGMKIRSFGGVCSEMLKKLGAVPVMVQSGEVQTSFERGIIDGALFSDNSAASFRLHEIGKYSTDLGLTRMGIPYCMNKKTFDALPRDLKVFFYNKLRQGCQIASGSYEIADKTALDEMKKAGVERIVMAPEEVEKCRKAVQPMWQEFIDKNEAKGLPAKDLVKDLNELEKKYSTLTPDQIFELVTKKPVQGIINF
jgi:TRAP-type transport system periplasmic protein